MTSVAQIISNRNNSTKSTGPKTEEGKSVVAKNALKHGILSRDIVLSSEDKTAYNNLANSMFTELDPATSIERFLVEQVTVSMWRMRRLWVTEAQMFDWHMDGGENAYAVSFIKSTRKKLPELLSRYEKSIFNSMLKGMKELEELQKKRGKIIDI